MAEEADGERIALLALRLTSGSTLSSLMMRRRGYFLRFGVDLAAGCSVIVHGNAP